MVNNNKIPLGSAYFTTKLLTKHMLVVISSVFSGMTDKRTTIKQCKSELPVSDVRQIPDSSDEL